MLIMSLPSGEVWIEIPHERFMYDAMRCHFPQGKCGLKCKAMEGVLGKELSLPSGEVWIEIKVRSRAPQSVQVTSLRGSVD